MNLSLLFNNTDNLLYMIDFDRIEKWSYNSHKISKNNHLVTLNGYIKKT